MNATEHLCTLAAEGVEVVTELRAHASTIHGGRLDGERFPHLPDTDPQAEHSRICLLARMAGWTMERKWRRRRAGH